MGKSLTRKIIESHFVSGDMTPDMENSVRKEAKPGRGNDIRR